MRSSTKDMMKKVRDILIDTNGYVPAEELCKQTSMSPGSIYRIIRNLRLNGFGVIPTPKGYVAAEFAERKDDVHFLRRLSGMRAGAYIALRAAKPHIEHRWRGLEQKNQLRLILAPLSGNFDKITVSAKVLQELYKKNNGKI